MTVTEETLKSDVSGLRSLIGTAGSQVKRLADQIKGMTISATQLVAQPDRGEMIANAMLAYRHLEDARMRLGKVIQAYEGGVSVHDK